MGWGPPDTVVAVIRDGYTLRLTCPCGHVAEPDLKALREALHRLPGWRYDLADLNHNLRCGQCGGKGFRCEVIAPARIHPG